MDKRDGNWDIYEAHDATAPLISSLTPGGTITTSSTTVTAIYSESGTGLNTASVALTLDGVPPGRLHHHRYPHRLSHGRACPGRSLCGTQPWRLGRQLRHGRV